MIVARCRHYGCRALPLLYVYLRHTTLLNHISFGLGAARISNPFFDFGVGSVQSRVGKFRTDADVDFFSVQCAPCHTDSIS